MASSRAPRRRLQKSARPGLADEGPQDAPSGSSAPLHSDGRDWASLTAGPAGLIAERALSNDVTDYVRFRAVCSAWRACAPDPRAMSVADCRFHPRRWILLPGASMSRNRRLLNIHTGERIHVRLPDRRGYDIIGCSFNGLLVLCRKTTHVVQLLNLVTGQLTDFPRSTGPMLPYSGGGPADDTTVVLVENGWLSVAKPGDKVWTMLKTHDCSLMSFALPFAGRLYCVTYKNILVVETAANQEPRLAVVAKLKLEGGFSWTNDYLYPVYDEEGDLILVHRQSTDDDSCLDDTYAAYRVKLDTGNVERRHDLGGQALFVCGCRSVSVAPKISSSITADTIYVCRNDPDEVVPGIVAFGLSGTGTLMDKKDVPDYLFDYLFDYVCS